MHKDSRIYIAGHEGMIGQAIVRELKRRGYRRLLLRSHRELDLINKKDIERFFKKEEPEYIFLMAGRVGGIKANIESPADFIYENIMIESNVIDLAYRYGVKKLLMLGCGCIYPRKCPQPIKEWYLLSGPVEPTSEPYSMAKISGIKMCQAYNQQYGTKFIVGVAANTYGPYAHFGEGGHVVSSLLSRFHTAKVSKKENVVIWGTGKPRRDFIYVDDVSRACIFLMKRYNSSEIINIGSSRATSIAELADVIRDVVGFKGKILYDRRRPDGMPERLLDTTKIRAMGWHARIELRDGIRLTYEWYKSSATITPS